MDEKAIMQEITEAFNETLYKSQSEVANVALISTTFNCQNYRTFQEGKSHGKDGFTVESFNCLF